MTDSHSADAFELARRHRTFQNVYFKQNEQEFARLASEGQVPKTLFIGCSDSRVVPELITFSKPGELFVIRTAGNFVPPYEKDLMENGVVGTIEFAVNVLGVHDIIVCGHSQCGAIAALFQDLTGKNLVALNRWLRHGKDAKNFAEQFANQVSEEEKLLITTEASIVFQLEHLLSFPFIQEKVDKDEIRLHGWYFDISIGKIKYYDPTQYRFVAL